MSVPTTTTPDHDRGSALCIGLFSLLSVFLMLHHPSGSAHTMPELVAEIAREGRLSKLVHAGMIALILLGVHGFWGFARLLDLSRAKVRAGFLLYAFGGLCEILAALISGFAVSGLAESYRDRPAAELDGLRPLLRWSWNMNQALAETGTIALCGGILLWSLALLSGVGKARLLGALGILAALAPSSALLGGWLHLHVTGMTLVVLALGVWSLLAALWMSQSGAASAFSRAARARDGM